MEKNITTYLLALLAIVALIWVTGVEIPGSWTRYLTCDKVQSTQNTESFADVVFNPETNQVEESPEWTEETVDGGERMVPADVPRDYYMLDGGDNHESLVNAMCSPLCCSAQYPTPFHQTIDPELAAIADQLVPSSYTCRNPVQGAGCACMIEPTRSSLENRAGNR